MKIKAKVLKGFHSFEEGETYEFKEHIYRSLLVRGYVEEGKEVKPAKKRGRPAKTKKTEL